MRLLLDTNILVDYFARREPHFEDALKLRVAQAFGDVELWACTQSYLDILIILKKAIPHGQLVSQLESSLGFVSLCTPTGDDLRNCLSSAWPDVEDQMIARGAERVKADYLVTRNVGDFGKSRVPVKQPCEVLEELAVQGFQYGDVNF